VNLACDDATIIAINFRKGLLGLSVWGGEQPHLLRLMESQEESIGLPTLESCKIFTIIACLMDCC
jgi:hypothetical protein